MPKTAICPHCQSGERLATVERIIGYAGCEITVNDDGSIEPEFDGYTRMDWDSSTTIGYWCVDCEQGLTAAELVGEIAVEPVPPVVQPARSQSLADALSRSTTNRHNTELARRFTEESAP